MKTFLALFAVVLLPGCSVYLCHREPTPMATVRSPRVVADGVPSTVPSGPIVISDEEYARYTATLARYSETLVPIVVPHAGPPTGKGQTWTLSREAAELWRLLQEWEKNNK